MMKNIRGSASKGIQRRFLKRRVFEPCGKRKARDDVKFSDDL
jgi:hypothetical protein